jgi:hypothetical protein
VCGAVFHEVESLFFKCYEFSRRRKASDPSENLAPDEEALSREIQTLIGSSGVAGIIARDWQVTVGIENILLSALRGDSELRFHAGDVDVNSRGVLAVLFNKIKGRLEASEGTSVPSTASPSAPSTSTQASSQDAELPPPPTASASTSTSRSMENTQKSNYAASTSSKPVAAKYANVQLFICPLCDEEMFDGRCLPCGIHINAITKAQELEKSFFKNVKDLFFRLALSRSPMVMRSEVEALLEGEEILSLVKGGWELSGGVSKLLRSALSGQMKFKFLPGKGIDPNSRGVLGCLFNYLRDGLAQCPQAMKGGVEIEKPYLPEEESLAFTTRRFPLIDRARSFLTESIDIFRRVVDILVEGGSDEEWVILII